MTLHFLDDVFRLNLALEAPQCVFERLAFLHSNLCQGKYTSKSSQLGRLQNIAQFFKRKTYSARLNLLQEPRTLFSVIWRPAGSHMGPGPIGPPGCRKIVA